MISCNNFTIMLIQAAWNWLWIKHPNSGPTLIKSGLLLGQLLNRWKSWSDKKRKKKKKSELMRDWSKLAFAQKLFPRARGSCLPTQQGFKFGIFGWHVTISNEKIAKSLAKILAAGRDRLDSQKVTIYYEHFDDLSTRAASGHIQGTNPKTKFVMSH